MEKPGIFTTTARTFVGAQATVHDERLAVEEPLEIRLGFTRDGRREAKSVSITMRTPGDDESLAAGFLFTEGVVASPDSIQEIRPCGPADSVSGRRNVIRVELTEDITFDFSRLERHFYTSSSCGVCGKTSIEALQSCNPPQLALSEPRIDARIIHAMPDALRAAQSVFDATGGLHAAGLFDACGALVGLREDVGRHNAVDKLLGEFFLARRTPLSRHALLVSGRASFELVQKSLMAGVPILAAVGAPSSLAVELANRFGMTLLGFVRNERFNAYSGEWRIFDGAASLA
jgi:FdhD protein